MPDYSLEMFSKDTALISKYAVNLPIEKKAELYALASYWRIENWRIKPDTINKKHDYSRRSQKKEIQRFKKEYLDLKNKATDWTVYYFLDLNQDSKLDIIEISRNSEDTTELWYPGTLNNHIRLFLSTKSNYYDFYALSGRITSLTTIKNEFHLTTISYTCCDEDVTYITKFHIPAKASKLGYDICFWANGYNPDLSYSNFSYNWYYNFPKHINAIQYYLLKEDLSINSGVFDYRGEKMMTFPKNEVVRVISESEHYYFMEFKMPKDKDGWFFSENIYVIRWIKKSDFEHMAVRLD